MWCSVEYHSCSEYSISCAAVTWSKHHSAKFYNMEPYTTYFLFCDIREVFKNQYKIYFVWILQLACLHFKFIRNQLVVQVTFPLSDCSEKIWKAIVPWCVLLHGSVAFSRPIFVFLIGLWEFMKNNSDTWNSEQCGCDIP